MMMSAPASSARSPVRVTRSALFAVPAVASIINGVGLENVMFEAADPQVFEWYVKNYGNEVNLFVDHSQVLQLEGLRQNIWGNKSTWGRIANPAPA
jgi:phosphosulfolactate synthase (CoM biosynthesis protein A)